VANKKILVKSSAGTKDFTWDSRHYDLREYRDGKIGSASSLEDAISMAKAHTGGSSIQVTVKDA
jgi:hypothetical protein